MKTGKMKTSKMKTSINLKTRKMKNNYLKLGMMAAVMLSASIGFAQTDPANAGTDTGIIKGAGAGESIKVIDNKGTIKYLQTNNGITSITSNFAGSGTTTTWQLGGILATATDIDLNGQVFSLDKVTEIDLTSVLPENQAAITTSLTSGAAATGYTFIVRDELTGGLKKMKASDLITGIRTEFLIGDDGDGTLTPAELATDITANVDIIVNGMPAITAANDFKLSVYRNGVKLRITPAPVGGVVPIARDFTVVGNAAAGFSVRLPTTPTTMFAGDTIEIVYLK